MIKLIKKVFPEKRLSLLMPYFIGAILFIVMPTVLLFANAFKTNTSFDNYAIVKSSGTWKIIFRSVWLGFVAALISITIALPYSWIIARSESKTFRTLALSLLISPLLVFSVAKIFALRVTLIRMYDYDSIAIKNNWVMIIGMIYMYMPFMIIPLYSVLNSMPKSLIEASTDLGYNTFNSLIKVVIPYCLKAIFSGIAIVFMLSSTSLVISNTLIRDDAHHKLVGNLIDIYTNDMKNGSELANTWGSMLALTTLAVVFGIYITIYTLPILIKKIRGGVND